MMRRIVLILTVVGLALGATASARQKPQEVELQAAIRTETVAGLQAAIAQYEQIVAKYSKTDRAIAAKALLRMAECYRRLGTADARRVYERIVREFPEQTAEVAIARSRLTPPPKETGADERIVWTGRTVPPMTGISPDGQLLAYLDSASGNVAIRTITTGTDRLVTNTGSWEKNEFALSMVFSRDGKRIAYTWYAGRGNARYVQLKVVSLQATGYAEPRTLYEQNVEDWIEPYEWSPDGSRILVQLEQGRTHHVAFVTTGEGSLQRFKSLGARGSTRVSLSPDGKHVAFDVPASDHAAQHDVFVIGADGRGETAIANSPMHESVVGWSPVSPQLVFMKDAGGGTGNVHAQHMVQGRPTGAPTMVRRNVRGEARGFTATGELCMFVETKDHSINTAEIELETGKTNAPPAIAVPEVWLRNRQPKWSADGKRFAVLASTAARGLNGQRILSIHSGGRSTYLPLQLQGIWTYDWSPDGRSFLARASDFSRREGIFQIDAVTGEVMPVLLNVSPAANFQPHWSADGRSFYYTKNPGDGTGGALVQRELLSGAERTLYQIRSLRTADGTPVEGMRDHVVSPDGKLVAGYSLQPESVLWVVSLANQTVREVHRVSRPRAFLTNALTWTPDSKALIVNARPAAFGTPAYDGTGHELWVVPVSVGKPRKLDVGVQNVRDEAVAIHPDGRTIAFVAGEPSTWEIRILENLLPQAPVKPGSK